MSDGSRALTPKETAELLKAAAVSIRAEVSALPAPLLAWHPAPGEWCIKEVLGHLIEAEGRGFAGRIRIILSEPEPILQVWDQDEVARARNDCEREADELLAHFSDLREAGAVLAGGLTVVDLARGGHHPKVGYLTVAALLQEWVHHDRNHLRQMMANVQAFAWPHMGNAQRFSRA
jgi:DinB superfamily